MGIYDFLKNFFRRKLEPQPSPTYPSASIRTMPPGATPPRPDSHRPPRLPENPKAEEPTEGPKVPLEALAEVQKKSPIRVENRGVTSICPYCQQDLKKVPQLKKKCPHCQKTCYVKYLPFYKQKSLVTEEEAATVDAYWARYQPVREWLDKLGITEEDFDRKYAELSDKTAETPSDRGVIWTLFNESIDRTQDYSTLKSLHYSMAIFLHKEDQDHFQCLEMSAKMGLLSMKQVGIEKVQILADESSCKVCRKLNNKTLTTNEALDQKLLPVKKCTMDVFGTGKGFCRCIYIPKVGQQS